MNENQSDQKAEDHLEKKTNVTKAECRETTAEIKSAVLEFPVPAAESDFLTTLMQFMRSAKRSQDRAVALAARRWETAIEFRIRMTLQERGRGGKKRRHAAAVQSLAGATASPSVLRTPPNVSPARG